MTKYTNTKLHRLFDVEEVPHKLNQATGKLEWIFKLFKKSDPQAAEPRMQKPCLRSGCFKPMYVAVGQVAYFHKECRHSGSRARKRR